jgi:site-specific DNA-methyltransferase (adenine-specific)
MERRRAAYNRTLTLSAAEQADYQRRLKRLSGPVALADILDTTIQQDVFALLDWLPAQSVDLLFADPPYNLTKQFGDTTFKSQPLDVYESWLESWLAPLKRVLKPTASVYVCGDWRSSAAVHRVLARHFIVRNRITWEREKGRGAQANWKNASEDIWFATVSAAYVFHIEAVKLKRRVIAPYTDAAGQPKDWDAGAAGKFRLTHPSNLWTDLTVPFWSMPENTDHPTQKPEKLLAKIILASSDPGAVVFDPFLGSGTTSVVARKLNRHYIGVEVDMRYACLAEKRLALAAQDRRIQGYADGVF